jgi:hypothetical protein
MTPDVARYFASAGRMPDKRGLLQVKRLDKGRQIVCVCIHVIAIPWLVRSAMTAAVMRDDTMSVLAEENHLRVPGISGKGPPVRKNDRVPAAPILVIDCRSVLHLDSVHVLFSLLSEGYRRGRSPHGRGYD